jgi:hypothetical protein
MITGYNTDIRYREKVFHVQTEDRGTSNPVIESVVYYGGQVLAARRSSYDDLLAEGKGVPEIAARMDHQHKMMVAAIRAGKLDKKMKEAMGAAFDSGEVTKLHDTSESSLLAHPISDEDGPTLDQVILDYLTSEAEQEQLEIALAEGLSMSQGTSCHVALLTTSSKTGLPVAGAQIAVKVISTVRDPQVLGTGTTDADGGLQLDVAIPQFEQGAAAVIISASSLIGSAEVKRLL